jgi:peptide/nickel transport system substrate-binding protein
MDRQTQICDVPAAGSGAGGFAAAQKSCGTLRAVVSTNPPSATIHVELTVTPFMAVFNNLVLFDQGKPRSSTTAEPNWQPQPFWWHAVLALG